MQKIVAKSAVHDVKAKTERPQKIKSFRLQDIRSHITVDPLRKNMYMTMSRRITVSTKSTRGGSPWARRRHIERDHLEHEVDIYIRSDIRPRIRRLKSRRVLLATRAKRRASQPLASDWYRIPKEIEFDIRLEASEISDQHARKSLAWGRHSN